MKKKQIVTELSRLARVQPSPVLDRRIARTLGRSEATIPDRRVRDIICLRGSWAAAIAETLALRCFRARIIRRFSIAACLLLMMAGAAYLLLPRTVSAAEMLHRAAVSTGGYSGWVHLKGLITEGSDPSATYPVESYLCPADGREAGIREREGARTVWLHIPSRRERFEYDSNTNEVFIGAVQDDLNQPPPAQEPTFLWLLGVLQRVNEDNRITATQTREKNLDRYDLVYPPELLQKSEGVRTLINTVWVDPPTQRIRKTEGRRSGQALNLEWTYESRSIDDIYDLGVPHDAKVVDTRPQAHETQIAANLDLNALRWELKRRVDAGFGDHTALVMQSHVETDGTLDAWFLHLLRKRGAFERSDDLYVGHNQQISTLRQHVEAVWPNVTLAQVFDLEATGQVDCRIICTPAETFLANDLSGGAWRRLPGGVNYGQWSMETLTWDYRRVFEPGPGSREKVDLALLPLGSRPEQWIGLRAVRTDRDMENKVRRVIQDYWYDPTKGYLLMERFTQYDDNPENPILWSRRNTLELAQTPAGACYPRRIRETLKIRSRMQVVDDVREEYILLDTTAVPEVALFAPDQAAVPSAR